MVSASFLEASLGWGGEQRRGERSASHPGPPQAASGFCAPRSAWFIFSGAFTFIQRNDHDKYEIIIFVTCWIRMVFISRRGVFLFCLFPSSISVWNGLRFLSWVVSTSAWELRCPKGRIWGVMPYRPWPLKFGECVPGLWSQGVGGAFWSRTEGICGGQRRWVCCFQTMEVLYNRRFL